MAGPVACVFVPSFDAGLIPPDVLETLRAIGGNVKKLHPSEYDLIVTDTRAISGDYRGEGRPFLFQAQQLNLEEAEQSSVRIELGFEPVGEFAILAMCNGQEDHRILAEMALHFAKLVVGSSIFAVRSYP